MADDPPINPADLLNRAVSHGFGVRFSRGVVGKTGHAMIGLLVVWAIAIWRFTDSIATNAFTLGAALVATAAFVWWAWGSQRFAERNPAQAMLEGAEFLEYQKIEAGTKAGSLAQSSGSMIEGGSSNRPLIPGDKDAL